MFLLHTGHEHLPRASTFLDFLRYWELSPYVLATLGVVLAAYLLGRWRLADRTKYPTFRTGPTLLYLGGFGALALSLVSPVGRYAGDLFFMHMVQHLLLMMVAVPLLLLANPAQVYLWALPQAARRGVGQVLSRTGLLRRLLTGVTVPVFTWLVFVGAIWVWHTPTAYNAALNSETLHATEHLVMFGAAVLFWWPVIGPAPVRSLLPYPLRFLYLFLALFQNIVLGGILTFGKGPIYSHYQAAPDHWGVTPAMDQQLGGIIMWIPGAMMFVGAILILLYLWLEQEERAEAKMRRDQETRRRFLEGRANAGKLDRTASRQD